MKVGERIKELRLKAGYTQNGLALWAGMSQTHLRRVELGQSGITVEHLEILCDALGVSLKDFFDVDGNGDEFSAVVSKLSPKQKQLLLEFIKSI